MKSPSFTSVSPGAKITFNTVRVDHARSDRKKNMKARRVLLTLEVETNAPLSVLRDSTKYGTVPPEPYSFKVVQAQANVIREKRDMTIRRR